MRVHKVGMTAFGPFKDSQQVDFDAFEGDGLFLIAGKTGAGKTSILDAICFGLYGSVPRFEKAEEARYRSDHAPLDVEPLVVVEFTVGGARYRIERSPSYERPKLRGEGTRTINPTSRLFVHDDDGWTGIASGNAEVGREVLAKVQLNKEQFLQVMLLAQNRFQEFLVAESKDRRDLLAMLFRTQRFRDYEQILLARRKELETKVGSSVEALKANVEGLVDLTECERPLAGTDDHVEVRAWLEAVLESEGERVELADTAVKSAQNAVDAARTERDRLRKTLDGQIRRNAARKALARAAAEADDVARDLSLIDAAGRAEAAWPVVQLARAAAQEESRRREALAEARAEYAEVLAAGLPTGVSLPSVDASEDTLAGTSGLLAETVGGLGVARQEESGLDALERAAVKAQEALADLDTRSADTVKDLEDLRATREGLVREAGDLTPLAGDRPLATSMYQSLEKARDAGKHAEELGSAVELAEADLKAATARVVTVTASKLALWQRRIEGMAGELATGLVAGDPCPVCGGTEHPAPAPGGEPVTADMLKAAEEQEREAMRAEARARKAVGDLENERARLRAVAGDRGLAELEEEFGRAGARLQLAVDAEEDLERVARAIAEEEERAQELEAEQARMREARDAVLRGVSEARADLASARARVTEARGQFASVRERIAALERQRRLLSALLDRTRDHVTAARSDDEARGALTEALHLHRFADGGAVEAARVPQPELTALKARCAAHQDAVRQAELVLADDEIAALPEADVEVTPAEERLDVAEEVHRSAAVELGAAQTRQEGAQRYGGQIERALEAVAATADRLAVVRRLAATVHGEAPNDRKMRLEDYVLAAGLEEIVEAANVRLAAMSAGRYALVHSDAVQRSQSGLGVKVLDQYTGAQRSTQSLSGGETFLASLALALGLAETVSNRAGGVRIDTLFIDEGFGSLDAQTLEVAMVTLDSLRAGGRTVGVISHVEAMHEAIPARLQVTVHDGGWSTVTQ